MSPSFVGFEEKLKVVYFLLRPTDIFVLLKLKQGEWQRVYENQNSLDMCQDFIFLQIHIYNRLLPFFFS